MSMGCRSWASLTVAATLLLGASAPTLAEEVPNLKGSRLVSVYAHTPEDLEAAEQFSTTFLNCTLGINCMNEWVVPVENMPALAASGLDYVVRHTDMQALIDAERQAMEAAKGRGWFDTYHRYSEINDFMDSLVATYPTLVSKYVIGQSIENRDIYGMTITSPTDNIKAQVVFDGTQHAREWISPATVLYVVNEMLEGYGNDPQVTDMLDRLEFIVVPVVNPDGYEYTHTNYRLWRKNRRNNGDGTYGVDLNRNWSVGFGGPGSSGNTDSDTYRGTAAFSEPETSALRDLMLAQSNLVAHIDWHSYSQLILRPYGYDYVEPPDPDRTLMRDIGDAMADAIFSVHGKAYSSVPSYDLYLASGICSDWGYGEAGAYAWTFELRDTGSYGFQLPPDQIIPTGEENWEAVKALVENLTVQIAIDLPGGAPGLIQPDTPTPVTIEIREIIGEYQPGTAMLYSRVSGGNWTSSPMTPLGGDLFEATLPATACGDVLEFYFEAQATNGDVALEPADAPNSFYDATALPVDVLLYDELETDDYGWSVGAPDDDATTGTWGRMDPQGTAAQPEDDHTPSGTACYVTDGRAGSGIGTYDIDGGKTTLYSPLFDASPGDATVSYWRWYSNDQGSEPNADVFVVDISDDGGSSWYNVETVGPGGNGTSGGWLYYEFNLSDITDLTPTATMLMRFVASDEGGGSIVEAAIDDFEVLVVGDCPNDCPEDLTGDGVIDQADLGELLAHYGVDDGGDIDGDGDTDQADLGALLSVYGQPCP
jgi:murein tripeptide amidase MpaA